MCVYECESVGVCLFVCLFVCLLACVSMCVCYLCVHECESVCDLSEWFHIRPDTMEWCEHVVCFQR